MFYKKSPGLASFSDSSMCGSDFTEGTQVWPVFVPHRCVKGYFTEGTQVRSVFVPLHCVEEDFIKRESKLSQYWITSDVLKNILQKDPKLGKS